MASPSEGDARAVHSAPLPSCEAMARNKIKKAIGDMKRRCELLYRAKGSLFDESDEI